MRINELEVLGLDWAFSAMRMPYLSHDKSTKESDLKLGLKLIKAGSEHRKFLRQITIQFDMEASMAFWFEFDTYKVGTVSNSESFWNTLGNRYLTLNDFIIESEALVKPMSAILDIINENRYLSKEVLRYLVPQGVKYHRIVTMSAEAYLNMVKQRKSHRLAEWRAFVKQSMRLLNNDNNESDENTLYSLLFHDINK